MARELFKALFTRQELRTHSLSGMRCPALGEDQMILPPIDVIRKNAILSKPQNKFDFSSTNFNYCILIVRLCVPPWGDVVYRRRQDHGQRKICKPKKLSNKRQKISFGFFTWTKEEKGLKRQWSTKDKL